MVENDKVRDASYIEARGQFWKALRIHFYHNGSPRHVSATRATSGAAILQGPHHAAQKSASTGTRAFATISVNKSASTSRGSAAGFRSALQFPQRPVSARCSAGMRFFRPRLSQFRRTGMITHNASRLLPRLHFTAAASRAIALSHWSRVA